MDPRADLQAATERNAREAREEQEAQEAEVLRAAAAKAAQEEEAAKARADAAAKAQAEAAAAAMAEGALLVTPLRVAAPGAPAQQKRKGGSGSSHPTKPGFQKKTSSQAPRSSAPYHRPLSEVTCNKCQQEGHYAKNASIRGVFLLLLL